MTTKISNLLFVIAVLALASCSSKEKKEIVNKIGESLIENGIDAKV